MPNVIAPSTSPIAADIAFEATQLQLGNQLSPETFVTICNVEDWNEPNKSDTVDVTNAGDQYKRRAATLLDIGVSKFKVFWVMTETTHWGEDGRGLRFIWKTRQLRDFRIVYPDGLGSYDQFAAYVTGFAITSKVGDVYHAEIELTPNDGNPTLI